MPPTLRSGTVSALVVLAALALGIVQAVSTSATDPAAPGEGPHGGNRQQWLQCRKQADARQLPRGDARREFMKSCMRAALSAPQQPASL